MPDMQVYLPGSFKGRACCPNTGGGVGLGGCCQQVASRECLSYRETPHLISHHPQLSKQDGDEDVEVQPFQPDIDNSEGQCSFWSSSLAWTSSELP